MDRDPRYAAFRATLVDALVYSDLIAAALRVPAHAAQRRRIEATLAQLNAELRWATEVYAPPVDRGAIARVVGAGGCPSTPALILGLRALLAERDDVVLVRAVRALDALAGLIAVRRAPDAQLALRLDVA